MLLIGKKAPDFKIKAVVEGKKIIDNFTLNQFKDKKYIILFFYPKDFTFVCPTELYAFQKKIKDFESRNTQIIAVSTDTEQSHLAWLNTSKNKGGIQGITYPIIADTNKIISYQYGVLSGIWYNNANQISELYEEIIAYRALFLIDKKGIIQHQLINNFFLGRNVEEAIRVIDALQYHEINGELCPANWKKGKNGIKNEYRSLVNFLEKNY